MNCIFCSIVHGEAPAEFVYRDDDVVAFRPLNPVTKGHTLFVPCRHVAEFSENPTVTADVMEAAARWVRDECPSSDGFNLITSSGAAASQTVFHLHVHVVPRSFGDGLPLPWTPQKEV